MTKKVSEGVMTPQAAPETVWLRRMRYIWLALCASLIAGVLAIRLIVDLFGQCGAFAVFILTLATPIHGLVYFRRKNAIDEAFASKASE